MNERTGGMRAPVYSERLITNRWAYVEEWCAQVHDEIITRMDLFSPN